MINIISLKKNNWLWLLACGFQVACSTSSYKISKQKELRTELLLTPDRIISDCPLVSKEGEDSYMFRMQILDEKNTVINAIQGNLLDKESCEYRMKKIATILNKAKSIYIGGMGRLEDPREVEKETYTFPGLGTFAGNARVLQFMVIKNDRGQCFSAYRDTEEPCPSGAFPIKD
jgi:hypothetical protein